MVWKYLAATLAFTSQPACAAVMFQGTNAFYSTYVEAGGTSPDGSYASQVGDINRYLASATLPVKPLHDGVKADASYADGSGTVLASASSSASATAEFGSASDVKFGLSGMSNALVTAAGGLDPQVFAGASPMYYAGFFYDFVVDAPTELVFTYASSEALSQGQFALGGTSSQYAFLSGTGSLTYVLPAGSYGLSIFDYGSGSSVLTGAGSATYAFTRDFTLKLSPATATAVPEPGTWLMLLIGIGGTGVALRRRNARGRIRSLD